MSADNQGSSKTIEATVAAGRSVQDANGRLVHQGGKIQLEPAEVKRLRSLGFLAEKGEEVVIPRSGPKVSANDGPRVTVP